MNLILNLTPDTEIRLLQAVAQSGKAPEAIALEALEDKLPLREDPADKLSFEHWQQKFRDALAALPRSKAEFVDDSRESIYEGCGE